MAFGISLENILLPFLFIVAPFLTLMIPVSYLLGTMIAFTRLSADNEYAVLLSAGMNLRRIIAPVLLLSLAVFSMAFFASTSLEAWGRREFDQFLFRKTKTEIDNIIRLKIQEGAFVDNFLGYMLYTEKVASDRFHYDKILIAPMRENRESDFIITAAQADIEGSVKDGYLHMILHNGMSYSYDDKTHEVSTLEFEKAELDLLRAFREKVFGNDTIDEDYRSYTIRRLYQFVKDLEKNPSQNKDREFLRSRYLFHSRIANPFLVFIFGIIGIVLGIHDSRKQKNWSYFLAIGSIMSMMVTIVGFRWLAEQGHLDARLAAWLPFAIFTVVVSFIFYQKNRLPISENILSIRNFPFLGR
jgi:lipopolysaccharide export LptBFGC system permease protein LptF